MQIDEDGTTKSLVDCENSLRDSQMQVDASEKETIVDSLCLSKANDLRIGTSREEKRESDPKVLMKSCKELEWVEPFAEVWLGEGWVPVEVSSRKGFSENNYLVRRLDDLVHF